MKNLLSLFSILLSLSFCASAQKSIDTSFNFQSDPAKKLSIYIPSSYVSGTDNPLMLGLHPWNTSRWNAKSWRDTLTTFAEQNGLILICPDGGTDGKVTDPIDVAFTSAMLDSIQNWYSIDSRRKYCMGFSWGGKMTYTYGLQNIKEFCGLIPIGAAVNIREVGYMKDSIKGKPVYIIHGANDVPNSRFTPLKSAMVDGGGIVNSLLMTGVGHTIDFPNRNAILKTAFEWTDSVCTYVKPNPQDTSSSINGIQNIKSELKIFPNPVSPSSALVIQHPYSKYSSISVHSLDGKLMYEIEVNSENTNLISPVKRGLYLLQFKKNNVVSEVRNLLVE